MHGKSVLCSVVLPLPCTLRFTCSRYHITAALDPVHSGEVDWGDGLHQEEGTGGEAGTSQGYCIH